MYFEIWKYIYFWGARSLRSLAHINYIIHDFFFLSVHLGVLPPPPLPNSKKLATLLYMCVFVCFMRYLGWWDGRRGGTRVGFVGYGSLFRRVNGSLCRGFVIPKFRYSDCSLFQRFHIPMVRILERFVIPEVRILRRFVIPTVRYSEGSILRKWNMVHYSENGIRFVNPKNETGFVTPKMI